MISINDLTFKRDDKIIFENLNLTLPDRGIVCICGPSGCGKSTLLRLLCGLEFPDAGSIDIIKSASVVFQENALLPWATVLENVSLPLDEQNIYRARDALEAVELSDALSLYPAQLSGGMARRVAIARALAFDGDVLLLDEPFNGLEPALWERICENIRRQYADRLIVLITHHLAEAEAFGAQIIQWSDLIH
ncbi:MAG: ATP-binding cassette domain-containing protein [Clostridia bacterium]|nr:ATP-binding cassette domain-containing protein [Clostridia bacterium]